VQAKIYLKALINLMLKNADKLNETQAQKLQQSLEENSSLNTLYVMKEQLLQLWNSETYEAMRQRLEEWCVLADQSTLRYLRKFAKSLRKHCVGICNYAKYRLTSARIEAGNISIGMIRKRARGIRDTEYFKLKIRQSSLPDDQSMFYI
jgi:transposase